MFSNLATHTVRRFVVLLVLGAMLLAACGGSSDTEAGANQDQPDAGDTTDTGDSGGEDDGASGGETADGTDGSDGDAGDASEDGSTDGETAGQDADADGAEDGDADGEDSEDADGTDADSDSDEDGDTPTGPPPCSVTGVRNISPEFPNFGTGDRFLAEARLGTQPGFDRFVLEFDGDSGEAPSSYVVQWSETPILAEGSGEPLNPAGDWYLEVRIAGASLFDFDTGDSYSGPTSVTGPTTNIREVVSGGSFEGYMVWSIGALQPTGFRVLRLADPARLVVDVCVDGPTWEDEAVAAPVTCPTDPIPADATFSNFVNGEDVDGDGVADTVGAYLDNDLNRWVLFVEPGIGGRSTLVDENGSGIAPGTVIGSVDVNGDGIREIFGHFDSGARAQIISVANFSDCSLRWLEFENGVDASFVVTGGIFDAAAVTCIFPEGWIFQENAINLATDPATGEPISWTLEADTYEIVGDVLVDFTAGDPPNPDPPFIESNTPPLTAAFNCGPLTY